MYMAIKFSDKKPPLIRQVKDESEVIGEVKKWEKDYKVRQVTTTNSGTGFIFLADKKPKYIWD